MTPIIPNQLTLGVLVKQLLFSIFVCTSDDQLELMLDRGPPNGGYCILEAVDQIKHSKTLAGWLYGQYEQRKKGFPSDRNNSHALPRSLDTVRSDQVELSSRDLNNLGV
jgi:hypothetical protein